MPASMTQKHKSGHNFYLEALLKHAEQWRKTSNGKSEIRGLSTARRTIKLSVASVEMT
jgi:hypothetical protein